MIESLITLWLVGILIIALPAKIRPWITSGVSLAVAIITGNWAIQTLMQNNLNVTNIGIVGMADLTLSISQAGALFILLANVVILFSTVGQAVYDSGHGVAKGLVYPGWIWLQLSIVSLALSSNIVWFLFWWEIMSCASFIISMRQDDTETRDAGIGYFVWMHLGFLFLMSGFLWLQHGNSISDWNLLLQQAKYSDLPAIFLILTGFAVKAAFFPFHVWLVKLHPQVDGPTSGTMSGIVIKTGIWGMVLIALNLPISLSETVGSIILVWSLGTGLYGIFQASVQNNAKKILAYSSVENMGIIGTGLGIALVGKGLGIHQLYFLGMAGAIIHTINHGIFKSILFQLANKVAKNTGSASMEQMGGYIKKLPFTAVIFLIGLMGLMGLPPVTGFLSEFLIYKGIWGQISGPTTYTSFLFVFVLLAFAIIGGMAIFTFTKMYSIIFLGIKRGNQEREVHDLKTIEKAAIIIPLLLLIPLIVLGISALSGITGLPEYHFYFYDYWQKHYTFILAIAFPLILFLFLFLIRKAFTSKYKSYKMGTWGCGYEANNSLASKLQYTSHSFGESIMEIMPGTMHEISHDKIKRVYPKDRSYEVEDTDRIDKNYFNKFIAWLSNSLAPMRIWQNGKIHSYILYGVVYAIILIFLTLFKII